MTACARSGCDGGVLDDDGICAKCFRAPESAGPGVLSVEGRRCPRPDCEGGTLDDSGICDRCRREEPAAGWPPRGFDAPVPAAPPVWWPADRRLVEAAGGSREPLVTPVGSAGHALARSKLGLELVEIQAPPSVDPTSRLLADSEVVERERRCPNHACDAVLGDSATRSPQPSEGRCPVCRTPFSFRPVLGRGEQLGAQYLIEGCIGYGGQGRVYLARDCNLDEEWVAVKGVRGDRDQQAMDTLALEKHTLIRVRHPDIVDIRNFVSRPRETGDDRFDVFIVLEFIAGVSLNDKKLRARRLFGPGEAISYVLATLPALAYLHESGLVYGDFKPANVMHVEDRVKLVDMGAVRRISSRVPETPVTTKGYEAPEARTAPPSATVDLYAVGRTLASLTADFDLAGARYGHRLPEPGGVPAFAAHESFYRFLLKATAEDPRHRFTSAAQMAEQLSGVLREVVAVEGGSTGARLTSAPSPLFTHERETAGTERLKAVDARRAGRGLPLPHPDAKDAAARVLPSLRAVDPERLVTELEALPPTAEVAFQLVVAHLDHGAPDRARPWLGRVEEHDWRYVWYSGLLELADDAPRRAWREFAAVRDALPGELAPKLALAVCAEAMGEFELARHYYRVVWRTDAGYVSAAFGLARTYVLESPGDPAGAAITVLEDVSDRHHRHIEARLEALRLRLGSRDLDAAGLRTAAGLLRGLSSSEETPEYLPLRVEVFRAARTLLAAGPEAFGRSQVLGVDADDASLGREISRVCLAMRRTARTRRERVALVREANAARPWTRW